MYSINDVVKALKKDVVNQQGVINISLADLSLDIQAKDIIGNSLQEWLAVWFDKNGIKYRVLANTQEFPDYIIEFNGVESYLDIKTWNRASSPAFDLANFNSYIDSLEQNPKKIDADYLVFGYLSNPNGFIVKDIFLKKIWEMTGQSGTDPLKIQKKKGIVYNIRPMPFYRTVNNTFRNRLEFLEGLTETKRKYANQGTNIPDMDTWKENIINNYFHLTGTVL